MTVEEVPAPEPVEPVEAHAPKGFAWVSTRTGRASTDPFPITILAGLADGTLEQIPVTEGLTAEPFRPTGFRKR